jgi:hypothetical protein
VAIQNQADQSKGVTAAGHSTDAGISVKGASRRRFARAGGVILTLSSVSGMATATCVSPSGSLSAVGSRELKGIVATCDGRSPGFWKQTLRQSSKGNSHPEKAWPVPTNTLFCAVFTKTFGTEIGNTTMGDLIESWTKNTYDKDNLARHFTATYLNIMKGAITFIDLPSLISMWNDLAAGTYQPSAGVTWTAEDATKYFEGTYVHD